MHSPARHLSRRLGLLGAGLTAVGTLWINWGIGLVADPRYGTVRGAAALTAIPGLTIAIWGWAWICSGILSIAGACLPNRRTWIGLIPAAAMPCIWAFAYVLARLAGEFPQGFNSGFTWLASPILLALLATAVRRWTAEIARRHRLEKEVERLRLTIAESEDA
ncbi:hypothetical protein [Streptomyces sp. SID4982]|uniref:hypothetical protein n=1 Tax=Streptomyces sp. SID4982 TaxID=2690291 RepID=UPI0013712BA3|nr:hypothetical protein [Streptomyces sp. SID4982]MYS15150.1 hypothetical protein [Streptomyces sp. SID4982]